MAGWLLDGCHGVSLHLLGFSMLASMFRLHFRIGNTYSLLTMTFPSINS